MVWESCLTANPVQSSNSWWVSNANLNKNSLRTRILCSTENSLMRRCGGPAASRDDAGGERRAHRRHRRKLAELAWAKRVEKNLTGAEPRPSSSRASIPPGSHASRIQGGATKKGVCSPAAWNFFPEISLRLCLVPKNSPQTPNFPSHLYHVKTLNIANDSCMEY